MKSNIKLCAKLENHIKSFTAEITRVHAGEESLRKPSNSSCDSVTNYFLLYINNQLRLVMNLRRAQTEQHSGILQHMEFHNSKIIKNYYFKNTAFYFVGATDQHHKIMSKDEKQSNISTISINTYHVFSRYASFCMHVV